MLGNGNPTGRVCLFSGVFLSKDFLIAPPGLDRYASLEIR